MLVELILFLSDKISGNNKLCSIHRETAWYKSDDGWVLIPTLEINKCGKFLEITFVILCFRYYAAYYCEYVSDNDKS